MPALKVDQWGRQLAIIPDVHLEEQDAVIDRRFYKKLVYLWYSEVNGDFAGRADALKMLSEKPPADAPTGIGLII